MLFVTHFGPCARPARISRPRLGAGRKRPTEGDFNKIPPQKSTGRAFRIQKYDYSVDEE